LNLNWSSIRLTVHKTIKRKRDKISEPLFTLVRKSLAQPMHVVVVVLVEVVVTVLRMTDMNWFIL